MGDIPELSDEMIAEQQQYFFECGGVPFDHWGKGCPEDCDMPEHGFNKWVGTLPYSVGVTEWKMMRDAWDAALAFPQGRSLDCSPAARAHEHSRC